MRLERKKGMAKLMNIIIAGTGYGQEKFEQYLSDGIDVVGYVQTIINGEERKNGKRIYSFDELRSIEYDKLVVTNMYSNEIKKRLEELSIDLNNTVFLYPWNDLDYIEGTKLYHWDVIEQIAPLYINKLKSKRIIIDRMYIDNIDESILDKHLVQKWDYFRYRTFELIAQQISDIPGCAAEAGVFRGEFAEIINAVMPQRKLYLFDTFESFNKQEYEQEKELGYVDESHYNAFKNTSVQKVLSRMPYSSQCIIKKGSFPETTEGIEEVFAFVSLDMDLEKSIYEGLKWFLPRMVSGGVIFVHDYNNKELLGVKRAVEKYEKKYGELCKIPLADRGGTLVVIMIINNSSKISKLKEKEYRIYG